MKESVYKDLESLPEDKLAAWLIAVLRHGNKQVEGNIPVKRSSKLLTYLVSR